MKPRIDLLVLELLITIKNGELTKSEMEEIIQKCQEAIEKYYGK